MTRHCTLPEPWHSLARIHGGVAILAETLHTSPRSIYSWAHQTQLPHWRTRQALENLFSTHGLRGPVWKGKR